MYVGWLGRGWGLKELVTYGLWMDIVWYSYHLVMTCYDYRHGIDGPNRNRWFTDLKNGWIFPWRTVNVITRWYRERWSNLGDLTEAPDFRYPIGNSTEADLCKLDPVAKHLWFTKFSEFEAATLSAFPPRKLRHELGYHPEITSLVVLGWILPERTLYLDLYPTSDPWFIIHTRPISGDIRCVTIYYGYRHFFRLLGLSNWHIRLGTGDLYKVRTHSQLKLL